MHIDFDEANACGYRVGTEAFILYDTPCERKGMTVMDMEQLIQQVVKMSVPYWKRKKDAGKRFRKAVGLQLRKTAVCL